MLEISISLIIGIFGSILCIVALALTMQRDKFGESINYKLLNFFGGCCLLFYAIISNSIPFIILESVWIALPVFFLVKKIFKKEK